MRGNSGGHSGAQFYFLGAALPLCISDTQTHIYTHTLTFPRATSTSRTSKSNLQILTTMQCFFIYPSAKLLCMFHRKSNWGGGLPLYREPCHVRWPRRRHPSEPPPPLPVQYISHPPQIYFVWSFVFQLRPPHPSSRAEHCQLWLCEPRSRVRNRGQCLMLGNIFIPIKRWRQAELLSG